MTGRSAPAEGRREGRLTTLRCDHREVETIDVLVNSVWGGYEQMVEGGEFTWSKPFWQQPLWRWDAMFAAGIRAHYRASQLAASLMVEQRCGLIVNISHWAAQKYIGNVAYGIAKAATDKMTADMAAELKDRGVAVVSLYPGWFARKKSWKPRSGSTSPIPNHPSSAVVPSSRSRRIPTSFGTADASVSWRISPLSTGSRTSTARRLGR